MSHTETGGFVAAAIITLFIFLYISFDWPKYARDKSGPRYYSTRYRDNREPNPRFSNAVERYKDRHERKHRIHEKIYWISSIIFTTVSICIGIAAACFAYGAYVATSKQASIAKDVEQRQLSAYIGPKSGSYTVEKGGNHILFYLKNYGVTPGRDVFTCSEVLGYDIESSISDIAQRLFDHCDKNPIKIPSPTSWPGDERQQRSNVESYNVNRPYSVFIARIMYKDIFDRPHVTYICGKFVLQEFDVDTRKTTLLQCVLPMREY